MLYNNACKIILTVLYCYWHFILEYNVKMQIVVNVHVELNYYCEAVVLGNCKLSSSFYHLKFYSMWFFNTKSLYFPPMTFSEFHWRYQKVSFLFRTWIQIWIFERLFWKKSPSTFRFRQRWIIMDMFQILHVKVCLINYTKMLT